MYAFWCLALLALTASVKAGCLCRDSDDADDFGSPQSTYGIPQVVTYGEPCACSVSLPYSVQIPKLSPSEISGQGRNYDYSIQGPANSGPVYVGFEAPIKIETPYSLRILPDTLRGRSYGVNVQGLRPMLGPVRHTFNFGVQKSVPIQRQFKEPDHGIEVQPEIIPQDFNLAPLPYAVQTPIEHRPASTFLTGLTSKVDRILVPASDIYSCPPDNEVSSSSSSGYYDGSC